jgi:hypothetical protein
MATGPISIGLRWPFRIVQRLGRAVPGGSIDRRPKPLCIVNTSDQSRRRAEDVVRRKFFEGIRMRLFAIISIFLAASSIASAETGLTGAVRNDFVETAFKVCMQKRLSAAQSDAKAAKIAQYCVCYSDRLADRISPEENKAFDELYAKDKVELAARLQPVLEGVAEGCAHALAP